MDLVLPLHPKLVHLPIALALLMPFLSAGLLFAWIKGLFPKRTWALVIGLQAVLLMSGIAALRTGEADEERVEKVTSEKLIKAHEEKAEVFVWGSGAVLLLTLAAGLLRQEKVAKGLAAAAVLGSVAVLGLGYRTGEAGGQLVYTHNAASAFTGPVASGADSAAGDTEKGGTEKGGKEGDEKKDHDDDDD